MSEFKNDPRGWKQKGAAAVFLVTGFLVVLFSGTGAVVDCSRDECTLRRREIFSQSEERFSRAGFTGVRSTVESRSTVQGRRGAASTNLILEADGREIPVFASAVGWVFGTMDYQPLEMLRAGGGSFRAEGVSLGGASLILAAVLFLIGLVFAILAAAAPINGATGESLTAARQKNARVLGIAIFAAVAFWTGFLLWFFRFLT